MCVMLQKDMVKFYIHITDRVINSVKTYPLPPSTTSIFGPKVSFTLHRFYDLKR